MNAQQNQSAANVQVSLGKAKVTVGESAWALVKIAPNAKRITGKRKTGAMACSFAVDCSGSMGGPASMPDGGVTFSRASNVESKMDRVKAALLLACESMGPKDLAGITAFSSTAAEVLPMTLMDAKGKALFVKAVETLWHGGSTALHDGWAQAGKAAAVGLDKGHACRVVLLTDGEATDGETNPEELGRRAEKLAKLGVETSCFGVGAMFNEDLLCAMAELGGGNFRYIPDAVSTTAALKAEAEGLASVVGKKVRLVGLAGDGVDTVLCMNGLKMDQEALVVPNLVMGRPFEALFEIKGQATARPSNVEFVLTWTNGQGQPESCSTTVSFEWAQDSAEEENPEVAGARSAILAAKEKEKLVQELSMGDMVAAGSTMANLRGIVGGMSEGYSKSGREMSDLMSLSASFDAGDANMARKSAVYQSYSALRNQSVRDDEEQSTEGGDSSQPA